jgi:hypothetical protein
MAVELIPQQQMNKVISHLAGVRAAVYGKAKDGAEVASAILDFHHHSGHARITVTRGTVDAFVNLDDTRGQRAAAAIEFGRSGGKRGASQGIYAVTGAFGLAGH